ncbi:hypothetical protein E8L99_17655 [Phreatobacter aquaticus]|uniref:Helix-turn-helix domain-containing protein n=1 Tax=Phreatobacter aquaticus TaxID=2570229 RepID=A0A4D7QND3_9HYPH|nr:hypothetical protein [Phreatobacter aquaticus]QCK87453.1 hypothetical protein E8L99_17655 [Phreatobacter aquaticus]
MAINIAGRQMVGLPEIVDETGLTRTVLAGAAERAGVTLRKLGGRYWFDAEALAETLSIEHADAAKIISSIAAKESAR